jgi:hypothetical protein
MHRNPAGQCHQTDGQKGSYRRVPVAATCLQTLHPRSVFVACTLPSDWRPDPVGIAAVKQKKMERLPPLSAVRSIVAVVVILCDEFFFWIVVGGPLVAVVDHVVVRFLECPHDELDLVSAEAVG